MRKKIAAILISIFFSSLCIAAGNESTNPNKPENNSTPSLKISNETISTNNESINNQQEDFCNDTHSSLTKNNNASIKNNLSFEELFNSWMNEADTYNFETENENSLHFNNDINSYWEQNNNNSNNIHQPQSPKINNHTLKWVNTIPYNHNPPSTINWNRALFNKNNNHKTKKQRSFNMISTSNLQPIIPSFIIQQPELPFPQTTNSAIRIYEQSEHNKKTQSASHIYHTQLNNTPAKEDQQKTALAKSLNSMLQNLKQQNEGTERLTDYFYHHSKKRPYDQQEQEKIQLAADLNAHMCRLEEEMIINNLNNNSKEHINEKKEEAEYISNINNLIDLSDPFSFLSQEPKKKQKIDDLDLENHLKQYVLHRQNLEAKVILTDEEKYKAFCNQFRFQITPCQEKSINEISQEFESGKPMNHILIGSVGFGKTEIALRTAYKVATTGQQVVIVAPTKTLAEQHFNTFSERFKETDINITYVPSGHKTKSILKNISSGEAKIIIGTHAVFSNKIIYNNIGYIIIDEEQRFGVKQKEKLHQHFTNAHVLWMSATPIPRTLELVNQKIMTSSTLKTPPSGRLNIITKYMNFVEDEIKPIFDLEFERHGQIFIVVSKINQINEVIEFLQDIYPDQLIGIAHGQMKKYALKEQLEKFRKKEFNILISTTVIEVGIDIPNANTMIIYDAQSFGIAALSQLRGRVGRSNIQAYCYVGLNPNEPIENSNSLSRLDAFVNNSKLGDDIKLSEIDLEIRGAGELYNTIQKGKGGKWKNTPLPSDIIIEEMTTSETNIIDEKTSNESPQKKEESYITITEINELDISTKYSDTDDYYELEIDEEDY